MFLCTTDSNDYTEKLQPPPSAKLKETLFHRRGAEDARGERKTLRSLRNLCISALKDFLLRVLRVLRGENPSKGDATTMDTGCVRLVRVSYETHLPNVRYDSLVTNTDTTQTA